MELFEYFPEMTSLPLIQALTYEAVQKRSDGDGLLRCLRTKNEVAVVCITTSPVQPATVEIFVPANSPQAASMTAWKTLQFSNLIVFLENAKTDICEAIRKTLAAKGNSEHNLDVDDSKISFQLVFFDADCRPLFVTTSSGILPASKFEAVVLNRRGGGTPTEKEPLASSFPTLSFDWAIPTHRDWTEMGDEESDNQWD